MGNKVKQFAKSGLKKVAKIGIPIATVLVILAGATWFIYDDEGTWNDDERGRPNTYYSDTRVDPEDGIVTATPRDITLFGLSDLGYSTEDINNMSDEEIVKIFDMSKKLKRNVTSIDDCTQAEILWCLTDDYAKYMSKPEELEYLLEAQLVTQYPKMDSLSDDKINGTIEFVRVAKESEDAEETKTKLTYLKMDEFNTKYDEYERTGDKDVLNYYTLDDEGNAIVVTYTEETREFESNNTAKQTDRRKIREGYTLESIRNNYGHQYKIVTDTEELIKANFINHIAVKTKVPYQDMVQQYSLPFEYLWALLVMGESYDFVKGLADLSYNSEIQIGIYDQFETKTTTMYKEYTENFKEEVVTYEGTSEDSRTLQGVEWTPESKYPYYEKETRNGIYNSVKMDIMYADVWIAQVLTEYENKITTSTPYDDEQTPPDEDWKFDGTENNEGTRYEINENNTIPDSAAAHDSNQYITIYWKTETFKYSKTTGQLTQNKQDVIKNEYNKKNVTVNEKVDIDENSGSNFVKLLRADSKAYGLLTNNSVLQWLLGVLQNNKDTKNMVALTKYLIYKAKDPDSEYIHIDFELMYSPRDYNTVSTIYGNSIEEKVWFALRNAGFSEIATAGAMGNIYVESDGFVATRIEYGYNEDNGGIGLCQWTNNGRGTVGRNTNLKAFAESKGSNWKDVDIQIQFLLGELTGSGEAVEMQYATLQFLPTSRYDGITRYTKQSWEDAEDISIATKAFCATFERPSEEGFRTTMTKRINAAQEYYDRFSGMDLEAYTNLIGEIHLTGVNYQNMLNMLTRAISIAKDEPVWDANGNILSGYGYSQELRWSEHYYDCSSFANRLYKTWFNIEIPTTTSGYSSDIGGYIGRYNSNLLPTQQTIQLEPGDVLLRSGHHVSIYLGNGRLVAARGQQDKRAWNGALKGANQIEVYEVTTTSSQNQYDEIYRFITE